MCAGCSAMTGLGGRIGPRTLSWDRTTVGRCAAPRAARPKGKRHQAMENPPDKLFCSPSVCDSGCPQRRLRWAALWGGLSLAPLAGHGEQDLQHPWRGRGSRQTDPTAGGQRDVFQHGTALRSASRPAEPLRRIPHMQLSKLLPHSEGN